MKRIRKAVALPGYRLRLTLTDGSVMVRAVRPLMVGPIFETLREDPERFAEVRAEGGTVVWPNGADLCPDVLIGGGASPGRRALPSRKSAARPTGRVSARAGASLASPRSGRLNPPFPAPVERQATALLSLDNTDFEYLWRKKMARVFVRHALEGTRPSDCPTGRAT